jgi:hypothetical protein
MKTDLHLFYYGVEGAESTVPLAQTSSNQSVAHGAEHAEDVAIRVVRDNISMFKPHPAVNHLGMSITKSPCTNVPRNGLPPTSQKQVGCTEELINLVTNGVTHDGKTYRFELIVNVFGLYAPRVEGYTQQEVLDASQEALNALTATGLITVLGDFRTGRQARFGAQ